MTASFSNGFRGTVNGAVQTAVTDQPGQAVAGMLAFASDINMVDNFVVGETNGVAAGKGISLVHQEEYTYNMQHPNQAAFLPDGDETAAEFGGIVVYDEHMQSDENGLPGWALHRMAQILRPVRSGGRIWVNCKETITLATATVNWVITAPTNGLYEVGDFAPVALGGGSAGTSVALPQCVWVTDGVVGSHAMLELVGTLTATVPTNSSSI
jgi:hypothetical protein